MSTQCTTTAEDVDPALGRFITHAVVRSSARVTDDMVSGSSELFRIAESVVTDVVKIMQSPSGRVRNKFLASVATRVRDGAELTVPQARGVLNVVMANCSRVRAALWADPKVQQFHRHRGNPTGFGGTDVTDCRVCGKPLGANELRRGIGARCWKRVLTS